VPTIAPPSVAVHSNWNGLRHPTRRGRADRRVLRCPAPTGPIGRFCENDVLARTASRRSCAFIASSSCCPLRLPRPGCAAPPPRARRRRCRARRTRGGPARRPGRRAPIPTAASATAAPVMSVTRRRRVSCLVGASVGWGCRPGRLGCSSSSVAGDGPASPCATPDGRGFRAATLGGLDAAASVRVASNGRSPSVGSVAIPICCPSRCASAVPHGGARVSGRRKGRDRVKPRPCTMTRDGSRELHAHGWSVCAQPWADQAEPKVDAAPYEREHVPHVKLP
jgi:hypothetical protein